MEENVADPFLVALKAIAADPTRRVYAVMDGTLIANLTTRLREAGLHHRPLVRRSDERERGDHEVVRMGPWLVDPALTSMATPQDAERKDEADLSEEALAAQAEHLRLDAIEALARGDESAFAPTRDAGWQVADPASRLEAIAAIAAETGGAVFWIGGTELSGERLHAHLRGLGKVLVTSEPGSGGRGEEMVIFRHADARVLDAVLPVLGEPELVRFLGPAEEVLFHAGSRPRRARRLPGSPKPPSGPLRLSAPAMALLAEGRRETSRRRIAALLHQSAPGAVGDMSEEQTLALVREHEKTGRAIGLRGERAMFQWTYLMAGSGGRFFEQPAIRDHLLNGRGSPDARLDRLMGTMVRVAQDDLKRGAAGVRGGRP